MRFYSRPKRPLAVNIVSLIDILCIVLIFFVVTSTFKRDEPQIKLDLPKSHQAKTTEDALPTIITVTKTGEIYLESAPCTAEALVPQLKDRTTKNPAAKFALKSSKDAPFGVIVKVMDAVRDAGLDTLPTFTDDSPVGSESPATP